MLTGVILDWDRAQNIDFPVNGFLPFEGELLIERQIKEMSKICEEIILVTNQPMVYLPILDKKIRIITSSSIGKGALSGMYAAFSLSTYNHLWMVNSDMPFICSRAAQFLYDVKQEKEFDAVIPMIKNKVNPYHAVYDKSCLQAIETMLKRNYQNPLEILSQIHWQGISSSQFLEHKIDVTFVYSIKTLQDYQVAIKA